MPGDVIDNGQRAEAAAIGELVMDEVHAPAFVGAGGWRERHAGVGGEFFAELPAQGKLFLAVESFGVLVVDDGPFGTEDIVKHRTAPARMLGGQFFEPLAHGGISGGLRLVLETGAIPTGEPAGAPLGQPKALNGGVHGSASGFGRKNFFASRFLRTIMSRA